jgi:hypothetical protein
MFHRKFVKIAKVQHVAEIQIVITNVNVLDVNVTTKSKAIEEHVLKNRKPKKQKKLLTRIKENGRRSDTPPNSLKN